MNERIIILGIESSCDDTSAAVLLNDKILANVVAGQREHAQYGGVVPELASRAHQQKIVSVVEQALIQANVRKNDLSAIAVTTGPGLLGSLLVGLSFAKGLSLASGIPLIGVNHMTAHIMAHFAAEGTESQPPAFPFLNLTVSGGHTQLVIVKPSFTMELIGTTLDDAAGEAFDKIGKLLGLPYPGGPEVDRLAKSGNPAAFRFPIPHTQYYDFSFSGLKTAVLHFIQKSVQSDPDFIASNLHDICASVQHTIVSYLLMKTLEAANDHNINTIAISGGVSANSGLRAAFTEACKSSGRNLFVPPMALCTDNAAMVGLAGYFKWISGGIDGLDLQPEARFCGLQ